MLHEFYGVFTNIDNALIVTFVLIGLSGLGWASFVWTTGKATNRPLDLIQWVQIYAGGFFAFLCVVVFLGFFISPGNATSLLETLHLYAPFMWLARHVQSFILWFIQSIW